VTPEAWAELVRAVSLSEEGVDDLRVIHDDDAGLLAIGIFVHQKLGRGLLIVHVVPGQKPVRLRLQGDHREALAQMIGLALEQEEE
jgi:hypothetical protein